MTKSQMPVGEIYFDGQCSLCLASVRSLKALDIWHKLTFRDLHELKEAESLPDNLFQRYREEMHLKLPDGTFLKGFFAFRKICTLNPFLWPLLLLFYFPLANQIGPRVYRFIADRRPIKKSCHDGACIIRTPK